jgi:4-hydroxymandelate oxidase
MTWLVGLEERARASLPEAIYHYIATGSGTSVSAREASAAWERFRFLPRVLTDVSEIDLRTSILGHEYAVPWGVAPTTLQRAVHPDGELAMARACAYAGALLVVSSNCGTPFAEIADTGVDWWLQAYLPFDRRLAESMLRRAVEANARAIVLTVDTPVVAAKRTAVDVFDVVDPAMLRANFDLGYEQVPDSYKSTSLTTSDIHWLTAYTRLPVVVKGVLRKDDAERCVAAGANAIWVSNHGGRQLDRAATTARCLSGVVKTVGSAAEVYVDGGVRSGLDVLTALSLGATGVFSGRDPLYALVSGESGVIRWHSELRTELEEALRLGGITRPSDAPLIRTPDRML